VNISVERFLTLTAILATSATLAVGCVAEDNSDEGASGGDAGSPGSSGSSGSHSGGTGGGEAGSTASGGGDEGGAAGAAGTEASAGSEAGGAGGGEAGTTAVAGSDAGGAAGEGTAGAPAAGSAGEAGSVSSAGAPGGATAGGAGGETCLGGDPAEEGGGLDCSTLPYVDEECPSPTGEGYGPPRGVSQCWAHADDRSEAAAAIFDCLEAIEEGDDGYCSDAHMAAADACVQQVGALTCANEAATSACEAINENCDDVEIAACESLLNAKGDSRIGYIQSCATDTIYAASQCEYQFRECAGVPMALLDVSDVCARVHEACDGVEVTTCESQITSYYGDPLPESTYAGGIVTCMDYEESQGAADCAAAFDECTT